MTCSVFFFNHVLCKARVKRLPLDEERATSHDRLVNLRPAARLVELGVIPEDRQAIHFLSSIPPSWLVAGTSPHQ